MPSGKYRSRLLKELDEKDPGTMCSVLAGAQSLLGLAMQKYVPLASCDYAVLYLIPKAFNNLGSIFPLTGNPCAAWNARIA